MEKLIGLIGFFGAGFMGVFGLLIVAAIPAYITHWIVLIGALVSETAIATNYLILLIAGVIAPPVGVIHGIGVWFGVW